MRLLLGTASLGLAGLILTGCQKYTSKPLDAQATVMNVDRARRLIPASVAVSVDSVSAPAVAKEPLTFARATELMRDHSPDLKEVRAEYETALALARVKTPLPNPGLEVGPQYGFGPDAGKLHRLQPFGSIGFAIPTGKRLKRQDEVNQIRAELARAIAIVRHRELYLELRQLYARRALAQSRIDARKQITESAGKSVALTKRLVEAGQATALDIGLLELEAARAQTETLTAENAVAGTDSELSQLIGVHPDVLSDIPSAALPELPETPPGLDELRERLVNSHPKLARHRVEYEVAERELRLEIARQYPDFKIGPSYDGETGEKKITLGLTLGIELPIFDRNQQAIATAEKRREESRVKYEAAANRALAQLERTWRGYLLASQKLKLLKTVLLPKATSNIELARKALEAGTSGSLQFLETERSQRAVIIDAIETEQTVREAWIQLEQAVGYPLQLFPTESQESRPESLAGEANGSIAKEAQP